MKTTVLTMTPHEQVNERIQQLQSQLTELTNTDDNLLRSDRVKRRKEIEHTQKQIDNFKAFLSLKVEDRVTDGKQLGKIKDLAITQGGLAEAWVSWYGSVQIPEQPLRLLSESILDESLRIGDAINVDGSKMEIKEFLGNGKVRTGNETVVEIGGNSMNSDNDTPLVDAEVVDDDELTPDEAKMVVDNELSPDEETERLKLEKIVRESFAEAGQALKELRDKRLYRSTHKTFEEYCKDVFGYLNRRHPDRLIEASDVVSNLITKCDQIGLNINVLPTNEAQCRPLTRLSPTEQISAWTEAVQEAGGKVPSSRIVQNVVKQRQIPRYAPNPFKVNDIVEIIVKGNPDLRGRGGQWAIIDEVLEYSCLVKTWDGTIQVRTENLKELVLPPEQKDAVRGICERSHKLMEIDGLDSTVKAVLASLSKKTWLSDIEESILSHIEGIYFDEDR